MKRILIFVAVVSMCSCYSSKDLQVEIENAELVKIDTIVRYPSSQQLLVWKCSNKLQYISYAPMGRRHFVGEKLKVLIRK